MKHGPSAPGPFAVGPFVPRTLCIPDLLYSGPLVFWTFRRRTLYEAEPFVSRPFDAGPFESGRFVNLPYV
jgi:hypothetical protein